MELEILYAIQNIRTDFLDVVMKTITALGNGGIFWIAIGLVMLCFKKTRKCGLNLLLAMGLTYVLGNLILKNVFARVRPYKVAEGITLMIKEPSEFSFPSGHTMSSFAAATSIFLYFKKPGIAALVLAALIGFSRMYVFVHYPTDILGGIVVGVVDALLVAWCMRKWSERANRK